MSDHKPVIARFKLAVTWDDFIHDPGYMMKAIKRFGGNNTSKVYFTSSFSSGSEFAFEISHNPT